MRTSTLTLALPDELYLRLERAATATRQSIEEVVLHALRLGSPPAWDDVPPEHQIDLAALEKLDAGDYDLVADLLDRDGTWHAPPGVERPLRRTARSRPKKKLPVA